MRKEADVELDDKITLSMGDWQWNAAIVGFINIVGEKNITFKGKDRIEFSSETLIGFESKFFDYLIRTYEKTLSWYKIVSFKDSCNNYLESDFKEFQLDDLKNINKYIKDIKKYLKSNSFIAAYDLIDSDSDMIAIEKKLSLCREPKKQEEFDKNKSRIIEEVRSNLMLLMQVINYCSTANGKKYIAAKNIMYALVKNAWSGVCFLNRTPKVKDMYLDYKEYFVNPAVEYLQSDKTKFKFKCLTCNNSMKDINNDLSFLNSTGFDVARKSSHVWNFQNDIAVCPVCKLIYSCLPAGFSYAFNQGIYVNANLQLRDALDINFRIKNDILNSKGNTMRSVYYAMINELNTKNNNTAKYELSDIQVVKYEENDYRFTIFSRKMQQIIVSSEDELNSLLKTSFTENNEIVNLYAAAIFRILNSQNLFSLVHQMVYYKLSDEAKCYFNSGHINNLLKVNQRIYLSLEGEDMESVFKKDEKATAIVKNASKAGYYLRKNYSDKGSANKLAGISYRLLNALKTSNQSNFMDIVLNCYLYVNNTVPKVVAENFSDDKDFKTMGYAFVAGLIDGNNGNENLEDKLGGKNND